VEGSIFNKIGPNLEQGSGLQVFKYLFGLPRPVARLWCSGLAMKNNHKERRP